MKLLEEIESHRIMNKCGKAATLHEFLKDKGDKAFDRNYFSDGHITGSAFTLNPSKNRMLLVHHKAFNKWLQPGGHADMGEHPLQTAIRESSEETGINNLRLLYPSIFQIDIHPIPARPHKQEPDHIHYDIRYLLQSETEDTNLSDESNDIGWFDLNIALELNPECLQTAIIKINEYLA